MSFIKAVGDQWHKSAFADKIANMLKSNPDVCQRFVGATSITTVANLIAAMAYSEQDSQYQDIQFTDAVILTILFDCFRLLMIKNIEHGNLSQAEHLIIELANMWANKELNEPQGSDVSFNQYQELQQQILKLTTQLDELNRQRRLKKRSM
ncbi:MULTISPECIES: hypothetical protein [Shewanella]|uniref:Uncharacterized protein n=1 Tax=Shewanella metallivivens TaxID=2872342 RepID=A0ABT5TMD6_9GAMM|nr:hypothetical protein [Shewanella metallivivens]MDD8059024.1 hypothetical protein [Shewanella metallivivens]